ncbi:MAG: ribose 5-phosphate isomerase A [Aggregatilineales bacterium]
MPKVDNVELRPFKEQAAIEAVALVKSGMIVGLGGGSTASFAVRQVGERLANGSLENILGIPCGVKVESVARQFGVPLTTLDDHPVIDLTIDGADEVAPNLNLIKGGGGSLLREKMVAQASQREIIIVDETKLSPVLGTHWPVPVEVVLFGWRSQVGYLEKLGATVTLRKQSDDTPFQTDQGNLILDCNFGPIPDPIELAIKLQERAGIVEHGLFLGLTSEVIVAGKDGIRHLAPGNP